MIWFTPTHYNEAGHTIRTSVKVVKPPKLKVGSHNATVSSHRNTNLRCAQIASKTYPIKNNLCFLIYLSCLTFLIGYTHITDTHLLVWLMMDMSIILIIITAMTIILNNTKHNYYNYHSVKQTNLITMLIISKI